jgi:putative transcriptional regulator
MVRRAGREARAVEIEGFVKNRLKVLRAERDWSQAELGGRLGVSRQAVNAIETGKYDPSLPLAFKLSRLFDVPIEEIFDDGFGGPGDAR